MFRGILAWIAQNWFLFLVFILIVFILLLLLIFMIPKPKGEQGIKENTQKNLALAAAIYFFIFLIAYSSMVIGTFIENFHRLGLQSEFDKWGQVGDYFGGMLNPILAFASFIALLYTIRIQSATQHEATINSVNDRKLTFLITEYNRKVSNLENILNTAELQNKTEFEINYIEMNSIANLIELSSFSLSNKGNGKKNVSAFAEAIKLESRFWTDDYKNHVVCYLRTVRDLKYYLVDVEKTCDGICSLIEDFEPLSELRNRALKHLFWALCLTQVVEFHNLFPHLSHSGGVLPEKTKAELIKFADESFNVQLDV